MEPEPTPTEIGNPVSSWDANIDAESPVGPIEPAPEPEAAAAVAAVSGDSLYSKLVEGTRLSLQAICRNL